MGIFVATASMPGFFSACLSEDKQLLGLRAFPQGIASGDPRLHSVVIWTRALPRIEGQNHQVKAEVSLDQAFSSLVLQENFIVSAASDHTLKIIVQNLDANQIYYYRFINAEGDISALGRTRTAPAPDDRTALHFAFVSCQNRRHGFYRAYRQMINDDLKKPLEEQIRFVLHLGDFIYETNNDPLMRPLDEEGNPRDVALVDHTGRSRGVGEFPEGGITQSGLRYAKTLSDYRQLYRDYLDDPDLQAARARWPFICVWDDHEFSDDCWQSEANYQDTGSQASTDEASQPRKVASNQAWFEYIPVNLSSLDEVASELRHAEDFQFVSVSEAENKEVDAANLANNADNLKAIQSMSIYRSFVFGAWMSLALTDNRSYRSDHAIPEQITGNSDFFVHPRMLMPLDLLNQLDAGKQDQDGAPDSFIFAGSLRANPRQKSPAGSMLGAKQKQWWKDFMSSANTPWKIWGNPVPIMRFLGNVSALDAAFPDVVLSSDSWDGYASERKELMAFLKARQIATVVSLSGDFHAHFAGEVLADFDENTEASEGAVMAEFVCAGLSSISMFSAVKQLAQRENPTENEQLLQKLISYEVAGTGTTSSLRINNLNNTLLNGVESGIVASETHDRSKILSSKNNTVNPHLKYADTDAHGFALVCLSEDEMEVRLVTVTGIDQDGQSQSPGIKRSAIFSVSSSTSTVGLKVSDPTIEGEAPFPL